MCTTSLVMKHAKDHPNINAGYIIMGNTDLHFLTKSRSSSKEQKHDRHTREKTSQAPPEMFFPPSLWYEMIPHSQTLGITGSSQLCVGGFFSSRISCWVFSFLSVGWMMQPLIDITCLVYCRMGLDDKTERQHWGLYS